MQAEKAKAAEVQPTTSSTSTTTAQLAKESKGAKAKSAAAGSSKDRVDAAGSASTTAASGHVTDAATPTAVPVNVSKTDGAAQSEATTPKQVSASSPQAPAVSASVDF